MGITYGYEVEPENDPYVSTATELTTVLEREFSTERAVILSALPFRKFAEISLGVSSISQ